MLLKWWHHNLTITSRFRVFLLLGSSALTQRLVLEHGRMSPEIFFKNNDWDRPLPSLWVVRFDPKICYFWNYVRSSDFVPLEWSTFVRDRLLWLKDRLLSPREIVGPTSALTKDLCFSPKIVCFDPFQDRLLWHPRIICFRRYAT